MIRIKKDLFIRDDEVRVDMLPAMFLDRGFGYLSRYIDEAVRLYEGIRAADRPDVTFKYLVTSKRGHKAYSVTHLCVYLAIKDLAHVLDYDTAHQISYGIWWAPSKEGYDVTLLWDSHPYAVAIRLASTGYLQIWDEALAYHRRTGFHCYLGYVNLFDIHHRILDKRDWATNYSKYAQRLIDIEFSEAGRTYDYRW